MADPGIGSGGGGGGGGGTGEGVAGVERSRRRSPPGRVREGGTPPAQLGGLGKRCKLP